MPSVLIPDAFFPCGAVSRLANSLCSVGTRHPLITLIARAKSNFVAYSEPESPVGKKVGRPGKYGSEVKTTEISDHPYLFTIRRCRIYNKYEDVSVAVLNLLWRPTVCLPRFVFAVTSHGPVVLMCDDPDRYPVVALGPYCSGIRVGTMSDMLKNAKGIFHYRFWSEFIPRHSRKPLKNKNSKKPAAKDIEKLRRCRNAYERYCEKAHRRHTHTADVSSRFGHRNSERK